MSREERYITSMNTIDKSSDSENSAIPSVIYEEDENSSISTLSDKNITNINLHKEVINLKEQIEYQNEVIKSNEDKEQIIDSLRAMIQEVHNSNINLKRELENFKSEDDIIKRNLKEKEEMLKNAEENIKLLKKSNSNFNSDYNENVKCLTSDSSGNFQDPSGNTSNPIITYKKYTYKEIEKEIDVNYFDDTEYYSIALDILATYLRGQKIIYMESKAHC